MKLPISVRIAHHIHRTQREIIVLLFGFLLFVYFGFHYIVFLEYGKRQRLTVRWGGRFRENFVLVFVERGVTVRLCVYVCSELVSKRNSHTHDIHSMTFVLEHIPLFVEVSAQNRIGKQTTADFNSWLNEETVHQCFGVHWFVSRQIQSTIQRHSSTGNLNDIDFPRMSTSPKRLVYSILT